MIDKGKNIENMTVELWIQKSTESYQLGKHEDEMICYDEALKIAKNNVEIKEILFDKILGLEALGRYEEAIENCNKILELTEEDEDTSFLWSSRESFLIAIGKYHEAVELKQNEAYKFFQKGLYDESVSWYNLVEHLLQYLKDEYNTDLFQKYVGFYMMRSCAKLYLGDTNGADEDVEKCKKITG